jgi:peptide/nickel transport system substrate-binding protein
MISSEMRLHILRRVAACAAIAGGVLVGQMPATAGAQELTAAVRFEAVPDPHFLWSAATGMFYRHYLATVMNLDSKDQPALGLAESFKVDPSSLVWEFRLRPDLKFANGTPITAGDIVASFERARTMPNAAGSYAGVFAGVSRQQILVHRPRHVGQDPLPIHHRPCPTPTLGDGIMDRPEK